MKKILTTIITFILFSNLSGMEHETHRSLRLFLKKNFEKLYKLQAGPQKIDFEALYQAAADSFYGEIVDNLKHESEGFGTHKLIMRRQSQRCLYCTADISVAPFYKCYENLSKKEYRGNVCKVCVFSWAILKFLKSPVTEMTAHYYQLKRLAFKILHQECSSERRYPQHNINTKKAEPGDRITCFIYDRLMEFFPTPTILELFKQDESIIEFLISHHKKPAHHKESSEKPEKEIKGPPLLDSIAPLMHLNTCEKGLKVAHSESTTSFDNEIDYERKMMDEWDKLADSRESLPCVSSTDAVVDSDSDHSTY